MSSTRICPKCGKEVPADMMICGYCGEKLPKLNKICPKCGKEIPEDMIICGYCGEKLPEINETVEESVQLIKDEEKHSISDDNRKQLSKDKTSTVKIAVGVVVAAIVVFVLFSMFNSKNSTKTGNENTDTTKTSAERTDSFNIPCDYQIVPENDPVVNVRMIAIRRDGVEFEITNKLNKVIGVDIVNLNLNGNFQPIDRFNQGIGVNEKSTVSYLYEFDNRTDQIENLSFQVLVNTETNIPSEGFNYVIGTDRRVLNFGQIQKDIPVYSDDYVDINYLGASESFVFFKVKNKTSKLLLLDARSITLDGLTYTDGQKMYYKDAHGRDIEHYTGIWNSDILPKGSEQVVIWFAGNSPAVFSTIGGEFRLLESPSRKDLDSISFKYISVE